VNNSEADFESEKLIAELNALDSKIDALDLTQRIEFSRLYRILNATVDIISIAENDLKELVEKKRVSQNFANKLFWGAFTTVSILHIVNYFYYSMSWFTALPILLFACAILYPPLAEPARLEKFAYLQALAINQYRFEAQCAGFTYQLLNKLNYLLKNSKDDQHNFYKIELLQKNECLRLCHERE